MIADRFRYRDAGGAQSTNIPHGWLAEKAAVFAIELGGAFVTNLKSCTRSIKATVEHQVACRLQPELFLILKRAHRRQHPEMMV